MMKENFIMNLSYDQLTKSFRDIKLEAFYEDRKYQK